MKTQFFATLSAAALSVALGLASAYAQAPDGGQQGGAPSAPAAQPSSPSGMTGSGDSPAGMNQREGDASREAPSAAAPDRSSGEQLGEQTKEPRDATDGRERKAAGSDREPNGKSSERDGRDNRDAQDRDTDRKSVESRSDIDRKSAETGDRDRKAGDRKGAAKIDANQKQKVRTYFSEHRPSAKRIDKSDVRVSIGVGIPAGIALAPLPPEIVILAADCPLQYFLWGDDVVLVDSCSREVVDIIPNIG
jgi:Protein of unknown function (DUF1236)